MTREIGDPIFMSDSPDGSVFSVGVSERSSSGRLTATGTLTVTVPDSASYDAAGLRQKAKDLAIIMVSRNPDLLTRVTVSQEHKDSHPDRAPGEKTPWSGGKSTHRKYKDVTDGPNTVLSADVGQVDI